MKTARLGLFVMAILTTMACASKNHSQAIGANALTGEYKIVSMDVSICGKTGTMPVKGLASFRNDYTFELSFAEFLLGSGETITVGGVYLVTGDSVALIIKEPESRFREEAQFVFNKKKLTLAFKQEDGSSPLNWVFQRK